MHTHQLNEQRKQTIINCAVGCEAALHYADESRRAGNEWLADRQTRFAEMASDLAFHEATGTLQPPRNYR